MGYFGDARASSGAVRKVTLTGPSQVDPISVSDIESPASLPQTQPVASSSQNKTSYFSNSNHHLTAVSTTKKTDEEKEHKQEKVTVKLQEKRQDSQHKDRTLAQLQRESSLDSLTGNPLVVMEQPKNLYKSIRNPTVRISDTHPTVSDVKSPDLDSLRKVKKKETPQITKPIFVPKTLHHLHTPRQIGQDEITITKIFEEKRKEDEALKHASQQDPDNSNHFPEQGKTEQIDVIDSQPDVTASGNLYMDSMYQWELSWVKMQADTIASTLKSRQKNKANATSLQTMGIDLAILIKKMMQIQTQINRSADVEAPKLLADQIEQQLDHLSQLIQDEEFAEWTLIQKNTTIEALIVKRDRLIQALRVKENLELATFGIPLSKLCRQTTDHSDENIDQDYALNNVNDVIIKRANVLKYKNESIEDLMLVCAQLERLLTEDLPAVAGLTTKMAINAKMGTLDARIDATAVESFSKLRVDLVKSNEAAKQVTEMKQKLTAALNVAQLSDTKYRDMAQKCNELEKNLINAIENIEKFSSESRNFKEKEQEKELKLSALTKTVAELTNEVEIKARQITFLNSIREEREDEVSKLKLGMNSLEKQIEDWKRKVDDDEKKYADVRENLFQKDLLLKEKEFTVKESEKLIKQKTEIIKELEAENKRISSKKESRVTESPVFARTPRESQIFEDQSALKQLQNEQVEHMQQLAQMEMDHMRQIADIQAEHRAHIDDIQVEHLAQLSQMEAELFRLGQECDNMFVVLTEKDNDIAAIQAKFADAERGFIENEKAIMEASQLEKNDIKIQNEKLLAENKDLMSSLQEFENITSLMRNDLSRKDQELAELNQAFDLEKRRLVDESEKARKQLLMAEQALDALNLNMKQSVNDQLQNLQNENMSLRLENEELSKEMYLFDKIVNDLKLAEEAFRQYHERVLIALKNSGVSVSSDLGLNKALTQIEGMVSLIPETETKRKQGEMALVELDKEREVLLQNLKNQDEALLVLHEERDNLLRQLDEFSALLQERDIMIDQIANEKSREIENILREQDSVIDQIVIEKDRERDSIIEQIVIEKEQQIENLISLKRDQDQALENLSAERDQLIQEQDALMKALEAKEREISELRNEIGCFEDILREKEYLSEMNNQGEMSVSRQLQSVVQERDQLLFDLQNVQSQLQAVPNDGMNSKRNKAVDVIDMDTSPRHLVDPNEAEYYYIEALELLDKALDKRPKGVSKRESSQNGMKLAHKGEMPPMTPDAIPEKKRQGSLRLHPALTIEQDGINSPAPVTEDSF